MTVITQQRGREGKWKWEKHSFFTWTIYDRDFSCCYKVDHDASSLPPPPPLPVQPHPLLLSPSFTLLQPFILLLFLEHIRHISNFVPLYLLFPLPQMLFLQLPARQALSLISSPYSKVIFSEKEGNLKCQALTLKFFISSFPFFPILALTS